MPNTVPVLSLQVLKDSSKSWMVLFLVECHFLVIPSYPSLLDCSCLSDNSTHSCLLLFITVMLYKCLGLPLSHSSFSSYVQYRALQSMVLVDINSLIAYSVWLPKKSFSHRQLTGLFPNFHFFIPNSLSHVVKYKLGFGTELSSLSSLHVFLTFSIIILSISSLVHYPGQSTSSGHWVSSVVCLSICLLHPSWERAF